MTRLQQKPFLHFLTLITLFIYCFVQLQIINNDLWNDEIYTLKNFVFTSYYHTLTVYDPNNHVLFNLINNFYLKLIGVKDLYALMDAPFKLRFLPFIYSLLTIVFTFITALKFFNKQIAVLTAILITTTIPYFNSATQIRGYGLSGLFVIILVYYSLHYLKYKKTFSLFIAGILTTFLFYTIPSNSLFIFGLLAALSTIALINIFTSNKRFTLISLINDSCLQLSFTILLGIMLSLIFYLPVIKNVFRNEYVASNGHFDISVLTELMPLILKGFLSNRLLLGVLFALGCATIFKNPNSNFEFLSFAIIIIFSFIPCYILGANTPERIFTILIPVFCLLLSISIFTIINRIPILSSSALLIIALLLLYSMTVFLFELRKIDDRILTDIKTSHRSQDNYFNYYIPYYKPQKVLHDFQTRFYKDSSLVLLHKCEPYDLPVYLGKLKIKYYPFTSLDSLLSQSQSVYVLSNHPNELINNKKYHAELLSKNYSYLNIVKCEKARKK